MLFSELKVGSKFKLFVDETLRADPKYVGDSDPRVKATFLKRNDKPFIHPQLLEVIGAFDNVITPVRLNYLGETAANTEWVDGDAAGCGSFTMLDMPVTLVEEGDGEDVTVALPRTIPFEKVKVGDRFSFIDQAPSRIFKRTSDRPQTPPRDEFFVGGTSATDYKLTEAGKAATNVYQVAGPFDEESGEDSRYGSIEPERLCVLHEVV